MASLFLAQNGLLHKHSARKGWLALAMIFAAWATPPVQADIPASERAALLALYNSTNGANWTNHTGWNGAAGTECLASWYGVTCNNTSPGVGTSHVTLLHLSGNNLAGQLPDLSGLPELLNVFFDANPLLTGGIPSLSGLPKLEIFYAYSDQLSGPIPDDLLSGQAVLTHLKYFDVSNNQLTGRIPTLAGLTALQIFDVSDNQLSGSIPALSTLTALNTFVVNYNQLTGPLPAPPSQMTTTGHAAALCPNPLETNSNYATEWNAATHVTPWWNSLIGPCDGILTNGFEI